MTVLVIDVGSSSVRTLLFDERAHLIPGAVVSRSHQFQTSPAGESTADPEHLRELVEACIDEILEHPAGKIIDVVGMATFAGNMIGMRAPGDAATPVYTYADTRSKAEVDGLRDAVDDPDDLVQRTGCRLHTAYHPARLRWLRHTDPDIEPTYNWIDLGTYFYQHWFGASPLEPLPCSYSVASWSGLLNRETLEWDAELVDVLELDWAALPPLADYDAMQTGLLPHYRKRWRALQITPFCLAVGDGAAANVGSGAVKPNMLALTVGTTAALRRVTAGRMPPMVPDGLWSYRVDADHHLTGGATSEGGNIFNWAKNSLRFEMDEVEAALSARPADSHGLTFLPLLAGERSPGYAVGARGVIAGLTLSTTPLDMLQAALEGVALRLALIAERLDLPEDVRVMAGGGALHASPAWAQIIANALDRPLNRLAEPEITARGVAILALRAIGKCELDTYLPRTAQIIEPQWQAVRALQAARERQVVLYDRSRPGWDNR